MDAQEIVALIDGRIKQVRLVELDAAHRMQIPNGERQAQERLAYQVSLGQRVMLEGLLAEIKGEKYTYLPTVR